MSAPSSYAYGPSAPLPRRRSAMGRVGKWMFIIGLVLSLITGAVVAWGASSAFNAVSAMETETIPVDGPTTISMPQGGVRFILGQGTPAPSCTVTDPDGQNVPTTAESPVSDMAAEDQASIVGTITATQPGDYLVECTGGTAAVSGLLPTSAIAGGAAAALGLLALLPLGLLTLLGLILWLVGRSRDRKAANAASSGGYPSAGYGYHQAPHQQNPYQQDPYGTYPGPGTSTDPYAPPPPPPPGPRSQHPDDRP